jgi:hypothetical protein
MASVTRLLTFPAVVTGSLLMLSSDTSVAVAAPRTVAMMRARSAHMARPRPTVVRPFRMRMGPRGIGVLSGRNPRLLTVNQARRLERDIVRDLMRSRGHLNRDIIRDVMRLRNHSLHTFAPQTMFGSVGGSLGSGSMGDGGGGPTIGGGVASPSTGTDLSQSLQGVAGITDVPSFLSAVGLPANGTRLAWPLGLRLLSPASQSRPLMWRIDRLVSEAAGQASRHRQVEPRVQAEMIAAVDQFRDLLGAHGSMLDDAKFNEADRFLQALTKVFAPSD